MRERWSDTLVNGKIAIDALEIVRLPIDSQDTPDETDTLLGGIFQAGPRTVMSLGRSVFNTAVNLSTRLLALLTSEG